MKTNVRESSIDVYYGEISGKKENDQATKALNTIKRLGRCTRKQVAVALGWQDSTTSRAVNGLLKGERPLVIEEENLAPCPITRRRVNWLKLAPGQVDLFGGSLQ